uniref:Uncharacterized protein n=1 Tax=Ananas comosus var. bracteatus TaxID=296719 RepID=A0A6V7NY91_ANACO|nr:unnamed protein product [Ananas comosus var. bracteatus]
MWRVSTEPRSERQGDRLCPSLNDKMTGYVETSLTSPGDLRKGKERNNSYVECKGTTACFLMRTMENSRAMFSSFPSPLISVTIAVAAATRPCPAIAFVVDAIAERISKFLRRPDATSKACIYADLNVHRPKEYWDYETLAV